MKQQDGSAQTPLENKRIALLGIKHSGKTSIGRRISDRFGLRFVDLDDLMIESSPHRSARDLFRSEGRSAFMKAELAAIQRAGEFLPPVLIATGGGIADNQAAMSVLGRAFFSVYLVEQPDVLYDRIIRSGHPAFLPETAPRAAFETLYWRRHSIYLDAAHLVVQAGRRDIGSLSEQVEHDLLAILQGEK